MTRLSQWLCQATTLLAFLVVSATSVTAAQRSEDLLPTTTKLYVSAGNVDELRASWNKTQIGQLLQDPLMKPFVEDLRRQLRERWSKTHARLGISWEDLEGVPGGEVSLAVLGLGRGASAIVMLVDITGKDEPAQALLKKIDADMQARQARQSTRRAGPATLTIYDLPKTEDYPARQAVFTIHDNLLLAADNQVVAESLAARLGKENENVLRTLPAYASIMERCHAAAGELTPQIRWFIEPFGYAEIARTNNPDGQRRKGTDMLKILRNEGFAAIKGIGGYVNFASDHYEVLHRTFAYAPASRELHELVAKYPDAKVERVAEETKLSRFAIKELRGNRGGDAKYELAARILDFPNLGGLSPQAWVSRELATYASFHCDLKQAFEASHTLVNDVVNDEVFEDVIGSIQQDPNGPQIDIRKDLVAHLGTRVTVISDYQLPITPKSERMLFAVETTNPKALTVAVEKWMRSDPDAHRVEFKGHVIWELVEPSDDDVPMVMIESSAGAGGGNPRHDEEEEERPPLLPNQAVTVAHGHLLVATHIDFLSKVLTQADSAEKLSGSTDYQIMEKELEKFAASKNCAQFFSRTDEEYRPVYELVRAGKMPEAESMLGRMLNALLGEGKEGVLRHQRIDGSKLPDYDAVRRYLGPAAVTISTEKDGWLVTGFGLTKEQPPTIETAAAK